MISPGGGEEVIDRVDGPAAAYQDLIIGGSKRLTAVSPGQYGFKLVGGKGLEKAESAPLYIEFKDQLSGVLKFDEVLTDQELGSSTILGGKVVHLGWYNLQLDGFAEETGEKTKTFALRWSHGIGAGTFSVRECQFVNEVIVIGNSPDEGSCDISDSAFSSLKISRLRSIDINTVKTEFLEIFSSGKPTITGSTIANALTLGFVDQSAMKNCIVAKAMLTNTNELEMVGSEFGDVTLDICNQVNLTRTATMALTGNHLENLDIDGCAIQRNASLQVSGSCRLRGSDFLQKVVLWLDKADPDISGCAFADTLSIHFPNRNAIPYSIPVTRNGFFGNDALRIEINSRNIPLSRWVLLPDNYWGGKNGPTGSYFNGRPAGWLDGNGGVYPNFPKDSKSYRSSAIHAVSGLVSNAPFPAIWVDDYRAGQHTLSKVERNRLPVRSGREMMICYDLRCNVPTVNGLRFWVEVNGDTGKRIPPYAKSRHTIQRDYAGDSSVGLGRTVNFVIPEEMMVDDELYITLHCDGSGVSGYTTPGPRETQILHGLRFTPWKPRAEPLRIGITDIVNYLPGYKFSVDRGGDAAVLKNTLEEEIPKMLPLRQGELEIVILPRYRYGKSFSTAIGSIFNRFLNTVSWSMHRELETYLQQANQSRSDKLDYLIAVVPKDSLEKGTSGETIAGSKVARVREDRHWSALHEFLHMIHLYEKGAEQYDLPSGRDIHGNVIENGSGAHVMGTTSFIPGDAGPSPSEIHHFPDGRFMGKYDIMGVSPHKWPVLSTLNAAFSGLGLTPPAMTGSTASRAPLKQFSAQGPEAPDPGTRRVLFTGIAERGKGEIDFKLIPGSITCRDVTGVMPQPITPAGPVFDAKLIEYEGVPIVLKEVWLRQPAMGTGTLVLWQQTFDIPIQSTGYQIRHASTNSLLFSQWDGGIDPANSLTGITSGETISDSTILQASVEGDRFQSQLFWRSGSDPWSPLGEVFDEDMDIPLSTSGLPNTGNLSLKLLSSDGFRASEVVIERLSVASRAPQATISSPVSGTWMPVDTEWSFKGSVLGSEDGKWHSSIDGFLGSGTFLEGIILSPGQHQITFTAGDSGSASATDLSVITVVEEGFVNLHVDKTHLNWHRPADDDYSIFPNTPRIGVLNRLDIRIPSPAETTPFRARLILEQPGSAAEVIIDEMLETDEAGYRSIQHTFIPVTRGTYKVTVILDPPRGRIDLNTTDNRYTWEFRNQAPVCNPQMVYCLPNQSVDLPLHATDPEGDACIFEIVKGPDHGSISGSPPNLIYTASAFEGLDTIEIRATDGLATSDPASISLRVAEPTSAPVLALHNTLETGAGSSINTRLHFYFGSTDIELKSPLPAGLSFERETGFISGTVDEPGDLPLTFWAYNNAGVTANSLNIHVKESFLHWIRQQGFPPD
ncbi:MAG TPA: putative Ig domain-containing protein, partial [Oceanipulchritudo sp.]|nr:putative Ig domain-containing protein [Oceanipulchritudo sp.]